MASRVAARKSASAAAGPLLPPARFGVIEFASQGTFDLAVAQRRRLPALHLPKGDKRDGGGRQITLYDCPDEAFYARTGP